MDNKGNYIQEDLVLTYKYKEKGKTYTYYLTSSDYTVEYSNATQAETATMTIKGKLEGFQSKMTYTGKEVRQPDVTLTYKDKTGTYTLNKDKDYAVS
ncbi:MAG: hypothetical protein PUB13_06355, partial [Lachnospiraceae bacterium]|nr:hypothetical protein [Lachnospiraceae bacterium]